MTKICHICGASLDVVDGILKCSACGAVLSDNTTREENVLLCLASQKLRLADFDGAEEIYNSLIDQNPNLGEAYWGCLLARFGIKYETDRDGSMVPTIYKTPRGDVRENRYYQRALEHSDLDVAAYYEKEAIKLEQIRKEWVEKASKEKTYDVFLSYKHEDHSVKSRAREIYTKLKQKKYDVFFSEESLKSKIGEKFEPYIMHAVDTSRVMVVYGKSADEISSTWIKNEWLRYSKLLKNKQKIANSLIVVCDGFSAKELPSELAKYQCIEVKDGEDFFPLLLKLIKRIFKQKDAIDQSKNKNLLLGIGGVLILAVLVFGMIDFIRYLRTPIGNNQGTSELDASTVSPIEMTTVVDTTLDVPTVVPTMEETTCITTETVVIETAETVVTTEVAITSSQESTTEASTTIVNSITSTTSTTATAVQYYKEPRYTIVKKTSDSFTILDTKDGLYYTCVENGGFRVAGLDNLTFQRSGNNGVLVIPSAIRGKKVEGFESSIPSNQTIKGNRNITELTIPGSIQELDDSLFENMINLVTVHLGEGITTIGNKTFSGCKKLQNVEFPSSLVMIGDWAFENCSSLTTVSLNEGLEVVRCYAFGGCKLLQGVTIPSTVRILDYGAFKDCQSLEYCTFLTTKITELSSTFVGCESLKELILPEGLKQVQNISGLWGLTYLEIPSTIICIDRYTFVNCNNLKTVWMKGTPVYFGSLCFSEPTIVTIYFACDGPSPIWEDFNHSQSIVVYGVKTKPTIE